MQDIVARVSKVASVRYKRSNSIGRNRAAGTEMDAVTAASQSGTLLAETVAAIEEITSNNSGSVVPKEDSNQLYWCDICKISGNVPPAVKAAHVEGVKHKKKEAGYHLLQKLKQQENCIAEDPKSGLLKCTVCSIEISTPQQLATHLAGAKHKNKVKSIAMVPEAVELEEGEVAPEVYWCEVCKLSGPVTDSALAHHKQGTKHLKKVAQMQLLEKLLITEDCFYYNENTGMLKCNVCNIEHNTPQLMEIHLESDKHKARINGMPDDRKPFKRKYYIDYDDPYQKEAKRMNFNSKDKTNFNRSANREDYSSEVRKKHFRSKDPSIIQQDTSQDKLRNLTAPHVEIKDLGKLMDKWACAYYRKNS